MDDLEDLEYNWNDIHQQKKTQGIEPKNFFYKISFKYKRREGPGALAVPA